MNNGLAHEQRLAAIGVLAGGIAHDFNNILTAILGYGERALTDAARGTRLHHDLEIILAAGARGRSLVDEVLTLGTRRADERCTVDVEATVREALDLLLVRRPAGVAIETVFECHGATVPARSTDIHRLFTNLATNALHAMPDGGTLRVAVATKSVAEPQAATVGSVCAGRHLVLQVSDSGVGIAPNMVHRVFDRFFTTREGAGGTGLGLSVVRAIVLEAGGAIDVESRRHAGTRFTVYLPLVCGTAEVGDFDHDPLEVN